MDRPSWLELMHAAIGGFHVHISMEMCVPRHSGLIHPLAAKGNLDSD